jgi:hypothetical protein
MYFLVKEILVKNKEKISLKTHAGLIQVQMKFQN